MRFYCEITPLPNPEINIHFLWSKLFGQLHLGLVEMKDDQGRVPIGISFPDYVADEKYSVLGGKCRLFAHDEATLIRFNAQKWLEHLKDYVHCTTIRPVPEKVKGYAIYQREQPKTNQVRLAKRYAKRHDIDFETAFNGTVQLLTDKAPVDATYKMAFRYCDLSRKAVPMPFIRLDSLSNRHTFCLWIKKTDVLVSSGTHFSSYGLSANSTVPEF
ncbi:MAG: type CRISPR-associated endoribonuclease Cas6/Csy4 [Pseudomonadota bacterium]|jgi:CRISPR-associated endonuclease Csy4